MGIKEKIKNDVIKSRVKDSLQRIERNGKQFLKKVKDEGLEDTIKEGKGWTVGQNIDSIGIVYRVIDHSGLFISEAGAAKLYEGMYKQLEDIDERIENTVQLSGVIPNNLIIDAKYVISTFLSKITNEKAFGVQTKNTKRNLTMEELMEELEGLDKKIGKIYRNIFGKVVRKGLMSKEDEEVNPVEEVSKTLKNIHDLLGVSDVKGLNEYEVMDYQEMKEKMLPLLIEITEKFMKEEEYTDLCNIYYIPLKEVEDTYRGNIARNGELKEGVYKVGRSYIHRYRNDLLNTYKGIQKIKEGDKTKELSIEVSTLEAGLKTLDDFRKYRELLNKPIGEVNYDALKDVEGTIDKYKEINEGK